MVLSLMRLSFATAALGQAAVALSATFDLPDIIQNGPVHADTVAGLKTDIDHAKVTPGVNATAYDWYAYLFSALAEFDINHINRWYFDTVSAATNQSLTVILYNTGPIGFITGYMQGPLSASISGTYANGTVFNFSAAATDGATLTYDDDAISGTWKGAGISFHGTNVTTEHAEYTLTIDSPSIGVSGNVTFKSMAPPHLPCGDNTYGGKETVLPHVYWSNTVPDAATAVDLVLPDGHLQFQDGIGYHDKNWGDAPFVTAVSSWYWGHARVGPYSLVWLDAWDTKDTEYATGYVVKDGKVLQSSCAPGSLQVRPWPRNQDRFAAKQGLSLLFQANDTAITLNITTDLLLVDIPVYVRAKGAVSGTILGSDGIEDHLQDGIAVFEQFNFTPI